MGITEEKLQELNNYKSSSLFSSKKQAILRYADAMTSTPVEIPDEIFQEISKYFNESQIVELTSAIAWENYRARFDHALKVESQGFSKVNFVRYQSRGTVLPCESVLISQTSFEPFEDTMSHRCSDYHHRQHPIKKS